MIVVTLTARMQRHLYIKTGIISIAGIFLLFLPQIIPGSNYFLQILTTCFLYATLALSWNLLAYSGKISLGHAAFFGVGAYGSSLVALNFDINPLLSIWCGGCFAAILACTGGFLFSRLKGAYFALTTLALVEIPKMIIENWETLTRGSLGLLNIPPLRIASTIAQSYLPTYFINLGVLMLVFLFLTLIFSSRWGWAINALRQDEKVSFSLGINATFYHVTTMTVSGFIAGVCGAIYAHSVGIIEPSMVFSIHYSALPMVMSLFGGRSTIVGPIVGAFILFSIDQLAFQAILPIGHQILYGLAIMVTILYMPDGIMGLANREHLWHYSRQKK